MNFGIRLRFALWLLAALLPVGFAAVYVFGRIEHDVAQRVATDLAGVRELEASRIENAVDIYREHAENLASGPHVQDFTSQVIAARSEGMQDRVIAGYDGFDEIDALEAQPLQQLAEALQRKTDATTAEVSALQIRDLNGTVLGETAGFSWGPTDLAIFERMVETRRTQIGAAFRNSAGQDHLGLVVPVFSADDVIVGMLVLENELGPIVDLVRAHEGFGETSEAHIAQLTADGSAEFITLLRFERDAAFNKVVPAEANLPINRSLAAPDGAVLFTADYRGVDSILAVKTLRDTRWGLVIKIDRDEALAAVSNHTSALRGVAALGVLGVLFGWAVFLDPIARRLRAMSEGAERLASGEYATPLGDRRSDEIGSVAKSIDRLAADLATDIAVRADIEQRLRDQAMHDSTTGLFNRQHATSLMAEMSSPEVASDAIVFSLLFLDLDNFKAINDVYGHGTGDEVLATVATRLSDVVAERGFVARWGGDEFVVVLPHLYEGAAKDVAIDVQRSFEPGIETGAGVHQVRASVGASTYRPGDDSLEVLLHNADEAMFAEKESRSGRLFVSPESVRAVEHALEDGHVEVWLQPIVTGTGSTVLLSGAEALVRLRDGSGELLQPGVFLQDVERSHVGRDLDRRMIFVALDQVSRWIGCGRLTHDFRLSMNCCEALMRDAETPAFIQDVLAKTGLAPSNLLLEISEQSSRMQFRVMDDLRRLGVNIAIDDLGLNNSNVDRLIDSGATVAKIDRRWLQTGADEETNNIVLRHLVSLCDSLGFDIIAQGVESPEQYNQLSALGVSTFQGYLFAKPLSVGEFAELFLKPLQVEERVTGEASGVDERALHNAR